MKPLDTNNPLKLIVLLGTFLGLNSVSAYEINEQLSVGAFVSAAMQCQDLSDPWSEYDTCQGAGIIQPEIDYQPTYNDEFYALLGFASGNALNGKTPFTIQPWTADLEDDVININGSGRNHLLTAWYKHTFEFARKNTLDVSLGLIDSTDYLGQNAFTGDEFRQFMNEAIGIPSQTYFLPSYSPGIAAVYGYHNLELSGVYMRIPQNDDGREFDYMGTQIKYHLQNRLGSGNYRLALNQTSKDFLNPAGTNVERRSGIILSLDQELTRNIGAFVRIITQSTRAAVYYKANYSAGFRVFGVTETRPKDTIGVGIAYLQGGNQSVDSTQAIEAYYRFRITKMFNITADLQYMHEHYNNESYAPRGYIAGIRASFEY